MNTLFQSTQLQQLQSYGYLIKEGDVILGYDGEEL